MPNPLTRALKYYLIGTLTFAANIAIAWSLLHLVGVHYLISTSLGFAFQTVVAFFVNRSWTFRRPELAVERGLFITTLVQLSALGIDIAGVAVGAELLGWSFLTARISAGIVAGLWAYVMDSRFTFEVSLLR